MSKKKEDKEENEKYNKFVGKLEKIQIQSVSDYEGIMQETEEESKTKASKATKKEIDKEIALLIGNYLF
jgi:hypothetical protein